VGGREDHTVRGMQTEAAAADTDWTDICWYEPFKPLCQCIFIEDGSVYFVQTKAFYCKMFLKWQWPQEYFLLYRF